MRMGLQAYTRGPPGDASAAAAAVLVGDVGAPTAAKPSTALFGDASAPAAAKPSTARVGDTSAAAVGVGGAASGNTYGPLPDACAASARHSDEGGAGGGSRWGGGFIPRGGRYLLPLLARTAAQPLFVRLSLSSGCCCSGREQGAAPLSKSAAPSAVWCAPLNATVFALPPADGS